MSTVYSIVSERGLTGREAPELGPLLALTRPLVQQSAEEYLQLLQIRMPGPQPANLWWPLAALQPAQLRPSQHEQRTYRGHSSPENVQTWMHGAAFTHCNWPTFRYAQHVAQIT